MSTAYRYEDKLYSVIVDADREIFSTRVDLRCYEFTVLKFTPQGFWINNFVGERRFVLNTARKRFACLSKAEALESFLARKRRQRRILQRQLNYCQRAMDMAREPDNILLHASF